MARKRKTVEFQKLNEIKGSTDSYWDWHQTHAKTRDGELIEHTQANPDELAKMEIATPSTPQLIMGEAVEHLQGRQREVYILLMRESKTYEETSEILGITRGAIQVYEKRAIKFIEGYCKAAIAKGRV